MPSPPPNELPCPYCGARMIAFRDKLYCTECEYFESCCDGGKMS